MKTMPMNEFYQLDVISKVAYAYKVKMGYFKFFRIRKQKRGWHFKKAVFDNDTVAYCPLCKTQTNLVTCGFMNAFTPFGVVIEYFRCEYCLIKLPVIDKRLLKLLGYKDKVKELPKEQMILQ